MIGRMLSHYEILEKLGEGGMGVVYKARDCRLERLVAVKVLPAEKVIDPDRKRRFIQEAKSASALNHPNIVTIHDIGEEAGVDFIVMEHLPGRTLDRMIPPSGMRLTDALHYAIPVADALAKAHGTGIVHRDLKPSNVLVSDDGTPKLLDFGLAKLVERSPTGDLAETQRATDAPLTEQGAILGTVAYMSPEQAEGKAVDSRADIFSFGVLLYEMVTGQRPFQGGSRIAVLSAILREEPRPAGELASGLEREIERLISRCLRKDPAKRWQTIADVRTLLEEFKADSDSGLSTAPRVPAAERRYWTAPIAAVVVLLLAGAGFIYSRGSRSVPTTDSFHPVPLTTLAGSEDQPSLSPDGAQVAFIWDGNREEPPNVYVRRIGPGDALRLTNNAAGDSSPAWSPDGNLIAFFRNTAQQGKRQIVLIPPLGGPERVIAEVTGPGSTSVISLQWTPDSKAIIAFDRPTQQPGGLWLIPLDSSERRKLTTLPAGMFGESPLSFAADGRRLIFTRQFTGNTHDLFMLPLTSDRQPQGEPQRLTENNESIWGAGWLNGRREIIFSSGWPGASSLWRMPVDSEGKPAGPRTRLTEQGEDASLAVSATGERLVFVRIQRDIDVYRAGLLQAGADTSRPEPLIVSSRLDRWPRYSPDGGRIAFASTRSGQWQLWVSDSDGKNPIQLTSFTSGEVSSPVWSRDGRYIRFALNQGGPGQAYVIEASGGTARRLTESGVNADAFVIPNSPDGKVRYVVRSGSVWRESVSGGEASKVFSIGGVGNALAVTAEGIYVVRATSPTNPGALLFYRFPNGPLAPIRNVERPAINGLSISPDSRYLIYSKVITNGADLMLVDNFK